MADAEKTDNPQKPADSTPDKKKIPKGGRKGGTIFPRMTLKQALEYSKKLVSKTAVAAQAEATILAGVFNNAGPEGKVRVSALKQLGLIEGTPAAYKATQLARDIEVAADEAEKQPLVRRAFLTSKVYRQLFDTYQADQASKGKIRGRAQQLGVHPDLSDKCADLFMTSAVTAGLAASEGDGIRLISASEATMPFTQESEALEADELGAEEPSQVDQEAATAGGEEPLPSSESDAGSGAKTPGPRPRAAADVTLNLTVDSSLDGDKLGRQLELLRRYGLI